ncbi:MAG: DUF2497 domain-containing protein [Rhodobiaceae bacterium]|nr:DUF2497 domain-containing protein [Rhodobiaceae bacterium]
MSKAAQQSEPSMEEILASIRKIISDENGSAGSAAKAAVAAAAPEPVAAAPEKKPQPEPQPEPVDDIFELTDDMVAEESAAEPMKVEPQVPEVDFLDDVEDAVAAAPEPAPQPAPASAAKASPPPRPAAQPAQPSPAGRLLSPTTDQVVGSAFSKLASTILTRDAHTLEDLVKDMLRPMLQEWLDDNLPQLVEKLVREEIERVSRGGH